MFRLMLDNVCNRPWTFERVPNKIMPGRDNALIFTATKESCLAACLNEVRVPYYFNIEFRIFFFFVWNFDFY